MNKKIFKAYDIRGIYPDEINESSAEIIGKAFANYTKAKRILVGCDSRASSPKLQKALVASLTSAGADVVLAGKLTTPMFYFGAANDAKIDAGIMVTASHNPGQYNGFKMIYGDAMPIEPKKLIPLIKNQINKQIKKQGKITKTNISKKYLDKLFSLVDASQIKPMKLAIDAGNGMAGTILPHLLERLGQIKTKNLYFNVDMTFPNHEANPLKEETLKQLKKETKEFGADMGIAYDGDGDRIGFVDENSKFVRADFAFCLILPELLKKYPKSAILYDLRCSKILPEQIKRLKGKPKMTRVGHAFIKKQLKQSKGAGACELSNHFYFKDFYGVDCADLMLLLLLIKLSSQNKPLSKQLKPFQKYFQSGEINFKVRYKNEKINEVEKKYKKNAKKITRIDGIKMDFEKGNDWWWLSIRASNTEPLLRLNIEANNKKLLEQKIKELSDIIKK